MKAIWSDLLTEVQNKDELTQRIRRILERNTCKVASKRKRKVYTLGEAHPNIYFTPREVETMKLLIKGHTVLRAAHFLGLSHRTVEYYVKNMKLKLGCNTKSKLIETVVKSDFFKLVQNDL